MGKTSEVYPSSIERDDPLDNWRIDDESMTSREDGSIGRFWEAPSGSDEHLVPCGSQAPSRDPSECFAARFELEGSGRRDQPTVARSVFGQSQADSERGEGTGEGAGLPGPGDEILGFKILLELGRGAFARVYLAEELNLGRRLVAIKVSRAQGDEPRNLARLQHTNIVPVHSVLEDQATGLRILCMPYFGGANLAQVLDRSGGLNPTHHDGKSLMMAIDDVSRASPAEPSSVRTAPRGSRSSGRSLLAPLEGEVGGSVGRMSTPLAASRVRSLFSRLVHPRGVGADVTQADEVDQDQPCRQFLSSASAIQAAVWIMARLAEGLEHAHSRGLLHRDIKPANILMASDGTPMLLDFNLSVEQRPASEGEARRALIGGTLPYMSPEHLDAFNPKGKTSPRQVDERSDIYALGLIFFEMLSGKHPFPDPPPGKTFLETLKRMHADRQSPPSLRARCPRIPWSLDALAHKCLSFDPNSRYARARDLAEDLRRFLEDRPMKHCPEPSVRERARKWIRRHPSLSSASSVAILSVLMLGALAAGTYLAYQTSRDLAARVRTRTFDRDYTESQFLLSASGLDHGRVKQGLITANQALAELGIAADGVPRPSSWLSRLEPEERERVLGQAIELMLIESRARVRLATALGTEQDRRKAIARAIDRLDKAERLVSAAPGALHAERARYHAALGDAAKAELNRRRANQTRASSAHELTLLGESQLAAGDPSAAEDSLRRALSLDVTSFWTWFVMGHCHFAQGRFLEAAGDFAACSARGPRFAWTHFNRGLALARSGRLLDAKEAYDLACALEPDFAEALVNRGLVNLELDQPARARDDLEHAIALGRRDVVVLTAIGEAVARIGGRAEAESQFSELITSNPRDPLARVARGLARLHTDPPGARDDLSRALELDPRNARALHGLALLERASNPHAALDYLDQALAADPNLIDAIELRALVRGRQGDPGTVDDVERLLQSPTPNRCYNAACALALLSTRTNDERIPTRAVDLLRRSLEGGCSAAGVRADPDLASLRRIPSYQRLIERFTPRESR